MKIHRIKYNWRYLIYEIKNDYYLVDTYDHGWVVMLFPFLGWFLYHKAYLITEDDFLKINKKINLWLLGGVLLIISPIIVSLLDIRIYFPNVIHNKKISHILLSILIIIMCKYIYLKFNRIDEIHNKRFMYMKIHPFSLLKIIAGFIAYIVILIIPYGIFTLPFCAQKAGNYIYLLNVSYLMFSFICIIVFMSAVYSYMGNMGPYDYEFKNQ